MATISGVRPETPFWDKLQNDECKMLQEFYKHADKIMGLETAPETVHPGKSTPVEVSCEAVQAEKSASAEKN